MKLSRRIFLQGTGAMLAMPAVAGRARAAVPVVAASLLAEDKPETRIWTFIRDLVETEMPGAFAFNIVPNAALGGEKAVVEGMRLGSIQASLSTLSNLSTWVPECQLFDLPFLFRGRDHFHAALESEIAGDLAARLEAERLIAPAYIGYGARHLLAGEPLTEPEMLAGKRIRVIQSPLHAALWSRFEALPIALPITETYNALSTGHVDAMDLTTSAYAGFRLYEVAPHVTLTGHIRAAGAVLFSQSFWTGLNDKQRALLTRAAEAGARHFNALMREDERRSAKEAEAAGAVFHPLADRPPWEARAPAVWRAFADTVGGMERIEAISGMG